MKVNLLNEYIISIFDLHAPVRTARITKTPWVTPILKHLMALRNKALSKYKKRQNRETCEAYWQLRNYVTATLCREKKAFLDDQIRHNGSTDNLKLLRQLDVHGKDKPNVPDGLGTVDQNNDYFVNIPQVELDLDTLNFYLGKKRDNDVFFEFKMATIEEIRSALFSIKSSAVGSDGIGISMLLRSCPVV